MKPRPRLDRWAASGYKQPTELEGERMPVELAVIGLQRDFVLERLEREFVVHRVWDAPDKAAALAPVADRIRGVLSNGMAGVPTEVIRALPNLEICVLNGVGLETTDLA